MRQPACIVTNRALRALTDPQRPPHHPRRSSHHPVPRTTPPARSPVRCGLPVPAGAPAVHRAEHPAPRSGSPRPARSCAAPAGRALAVLAGAAEGGVPTLLAGNARQAAFDLLQRAGQGLLEGDVGGLALGIGQFDGGATVCIVQQRQAEGGADPGEVRSAGNGVAQAKPERPRQPAPPVSGTGRGGRPVPAARRRPAAPLRRSGPGDGATGRWADRRRCAIRPTAPPYWRRAGRRYCPAARQAGYPAPAALRARWMSSSSRSASSDARSADVASTSSRVTSPA